MRGCPGSTAFRQHLDYSESGLSALLFPPFFLIAQRGLTRTGGCPRRLARCAIRIILVYEFLQPELEQTRPVLLYTAEEPQDGQVVATPSLMCFTSFIVVCDVTIAQVLLFPGQRLRFFVFRGDFNENCLPLSFTAYHDTDAKPSNGSLFLKNCSSAACLNNRQRLSRQCDIFCFFCNNPPPAQRVVFGYTISGQQPQLPAV